MMEGNYNDEYNDFMKECDILFLFWSLSSQEKKLYIYK